MSNVEYLKKLVINDQKERVDRSIPFPTKTSTPPLKEKSRCLAIRSICTKDLHTMTPYRECEPVPFSLYHKPKEIVREDPYAIQHQHTFVKPLQGPEHKEIQRTRPRLVMTPAVSLNDTDDRRREIIVNDIYASCYQRTYNQKHGNHVCAPLPCRFFPAKPIYPRPLKHYNVPFEWRSKTLNWEGKQLRCTEDLNVAFWGKKNLYKNCHSCKATAQIQEMRKTHL